MVQLYSTLTSSQNPLAISFFNDKDYLPEINSQHHYKNCNIKGISIKFRNNTDMPIIMTMPYMLTIVLKFLASKIGEGSEILVYIENYELILTIG